MTPCLSPIAEQFCHDLFTAAWEAPNELVRAVPAGYSQAIAAGFPDTHSFRIYARADFIPRNVLRAAETYLPVFSDSVRCFLPEGELYLEGFKRTLSDLEDNAFLRGSVSLFALKHLAWRVNEIPANTEVEEVFYLSAGECFAAKGWKMERALDILVFLRHLGHFANAEWTSHPFTRAFCDLYLSDYDREMASVPTGLFPLFRQRPTYLEEREARALLGEVASIGDLAKILEGASEGDRALARGRAAAEALSRLDDHDARRILKWAVWNHRDLEIRHAAAKALHRIVLRALGRA